MSDSVSVLDHGFARLVDHMGSDLSIVRAARVSYAAAWRAGEDAGRQGLRKRAVQPTPNRAILVNRLTGVRFVRRLDDGAVPWRRPGNDPV